MRRSSAPQRPSRSTKTKLADAEPEKRKAYLAISCGQATIQAMLSSDANADSASGYDRPAVPPFRVVYLGLWAAGAVAWIAMSVAADAVFGRIDTQIGPWAGRIITGVCETGFCGLLVGAGIAVRFSRAAGIRSLRPGHWILVNYAIFIILGTLLSPIWRWNWPSEPSTQLMELVMGATQAVGGFLFLYAVVKLDDAQSWKSSFAAFALAGFAVGAFSADLRHNIVHNWNADFDLSIKKIDRLHFNLLTFVTAADQYLGWEYLNSNLKTNEKGKKRKSKRK